MAFSSEDKHRVIFALCHTGKIIEPGSTHFNSIINDRLEGLNQFIEDRALALVQEIEDQKARVKAASSNGNVKRIGDIELDTNATIDLAYKELARLLDELSKLLDIPNNCRGGRGGSAKVCW
jgi:hypothetical protein